MTLKSYFKAYWFMKKTQTKKSHATVPLRNKNVYKFYFAKFWERNITILWKANLKFCKLSAKFLVKKFAWSPYLQNRGIVPGKDIKGIKIGKVIFAVITWPLNEQLIQSIWAESHESTTIFLDRNIVVLTWLSAHTALIGCYFNGQLTTAKNTLPIFIPLIIFGPLLWKSQHICGNKCRVAKYRDFF